MHVQVPAQPRADLGAGAVGRRVRFRRVDLEPFEIGRGAAGERLGDDARGRVPDARELAQRAALGPFPELVGVELPDHVDRAPERLDLVRGGLGPFQQEGDPVQCFERLHASEGTRSPPESPGRREARSHGPNALSARG